MSPFENRSFYVDTTDKNQNNDNFYDLLKGNGWSKLNENQKKNLSNISIKNGNYIKIKDGIVYKNNIKILKLNYRTKKQIEKLPKNEYFNKEALKSIKLSGKIDINNRRFAPAKIEINKEGKDGKIEKMFINPTNFIVTEVINGKFILSYYENNKLKLIDLASPGRKGKLTPKENTIVKVVGGDGTYKSKKYKVPLKYAIIVNTNYNEWNGIFIHAGKTYGNPKSHGCIRLKEKTAKLLYNMVKNNKNKVGNYVLDNTINKIKIKSRTKPKPRTRPKNIKAYSYENYPETKPKPEPGLDLY